MKRLLICASFQVQFTGSGGAGIDYINPTDDPRKK